MSEPETRDRSTASYGGVAIDVIETDDSIARALVQHTYPRKDGGDLVDFGAEPRVTSCRIVFFDRPPDADDPSRLTYQQRFAKFLEVASRGTAQAFQHPFAGRYQAFVQDLSYRASGDSDGIDVECTFVEDTTTPAVFDPGDGRAIDTGTAAVTTEGALLDAAAEEQGIDSTIGVDTADVVASWLTRADITAREVNAELGSISAAIDEAIEAHDLATDPSRYPLFRSYQRLHYAVRRAADRFRQSQPQIYELTLAVAKPLRVLVAENYGAADIERRYTEIQRLNDLDDPTLIPAGSTLKVPARTAAERSRSR